MESRTRLQCSPSESFFYKMDHNLKLWKKQSCGHFCVLTIRLKSWIPVGYSREYCRSFPPSFLGKRLLFLLWENPKIFSPCEFSVDSFVILSKSLSVIDADDVDNTNLLAILSHNYRRNVSSVMPAICGFYIFGNNFHSQQNSMDSRKFKIAINAI